MAIARLGWADRLAASTPRAPELPARIARGARGLHALLANKYYVDELYDAVIVRPLVRISDAVLYRGIDAGVIDGAGERRPRAARAAGSRRAGCAGSSRASRRATSSSMLAGTAAILWYLLR